MEQAGQDSRHLQFTYRNYEDNNRSLNSIVIGQQYTIKKELGRGNFGKVYLATNKKSQNFALKLLDLRQLAKQSNPRIKQIRERLVASEPKLMRQCNSPNLLKCFDIFENQDFKLLVLEHCSGGTLDAYLKKKKRLPESEAVAILRQIINGIAELHRHKIVHRDLKTENIMEHEGNYKIIDFGFSKKLQIQNEGDSIKNTLLGTPTTMAPEVFSRKQYGLKADIWSIGIIFFEMVFGVQPYDSSNATSFYGKIQKQFQVEKPQKFNGIELSKNAYDFLGKVLRIKQEERIGWRQLLQHPLIKIKQEEPLIQRFIQRHSIYEPEVDSALAQGKLNSEAIKIIPEQKKEESSPVKKKEEKDAREELDQKARAEKINKKQISSEEKEKNGKQVKINLIHLMNKQKQQNEERVRKVKLIQQLKAKIQQRQSKNPRYEEFREEEEKKSQEYQRCLGMHLECLKTQLFFHEIFQPIQNHNLLNLGQRQSMEFMHLLISRCFKNMSPLKEQIRKNPENIHKAFKNLDQQVKNLYNKVTAKFQQYDQLLRQKENKYLQIAKDFWWKMVKNDTQNEKNKFIGGVQCRPGGLFGDFTKEEQIAYTQTFIYTVIVKIMDMGEISKKVKRYLQHYRQLCQVTFTQLGDRSYKEYVQFIIG